MLEGILMKSYKKFISEENSIKLNPKKEFIKFSYKDKTFKISLFDYKKDHAGFTGEFWDYQMNIAKTVFKLRKGRTDLMKTEWPPARIEYLNIVQPFDLIKINGKGYWGQEHRGIKKGWRVVGEVIRSNNGRTSGSGKAMAAELNSKYVDWTPPEEDGMKNYGETGDLRIERRHTDEFDVHSDIDEVISQYDSPKLWVKTMKKYYK
jgi:hypothetical protein